MRESTIEKKVVEYCREKGLLCYKFSSPSRRGVPDRIILGKGKILFLELKATGQKPSKLQFREMAILAEQDFQSSWADSFEVAVDIIESRFFQ